MPVRRRTKLEGEDETKRAGHFRVLGRRLADIGSNAGAVAISALALICSGVSFHETVLKQARLHLFVPDAIAYTGDPDGGFEVFAVPLTVSNSGARDGIVSALKLEVRNAAISAKQMLEASYFAGPDYLSVKEDAANNIPRPKTPFAPISVSGCSGHTATVLFYARKYELWRVVSGGGQYELLPIAEARRAEKGPSARGGAAL
jgi:hypothetical protein